MKTTKQILILFLIINCQLLIVNYTNAQNITADTTLANQHFESAKDYFNNGVYDTAAVNFAEASMLYEKHEQWRKYLLSETKHGECYQKQRHLDKAVNTIKPAIEKTVAQIGENDIIVADAFKSLGFKYYFQSKFDDVLIYWKKTLKIQVELLGEKHVDVAWCCNALGIIYKNKFEHDKALEYYFRSLEIYKELLGESHTRVATIYNNIGILYKNKSEYDKALQYYFKSLEIRKELLEENHLDLAKSYNNFGILYSLKSEYDKALQYYFKSLEIRKELLGEKHVDVAASLNNIGVVYSNKSEYDKALQYYFKSLEIKKELLGEKHVDVAASYNNIGVVYDEKSEYDKALQYYFKSLEIRKELLGEKHVSVAMSYNNIGIIYSSKSEYDKALQYYYKCCEIEKELLGEKHVDVAASYNNIGVIYYNKSEYDKALQYYFKSLEIKKELLGEKHVSVAMSYHSLGAVYHKKLEFNLALEYYKKALSIYKKLLGEKHVDMADSYNNIGEVFRDSMQYEIALKYYHLAMAADLREFNDTTNITKVPAMKNYIEHTQLLQALQAKAEILSDTNSTFPKFETLEKLELALRHYQAADTLISLVRQNISTKSDKLALGEQASEVYKGAVNVCIALSDAATNVATRHALSLQTGYKEQAFYFSEKNKSSVLLEALAGSEALEYVGIPDSLLQTEHKLSTDITNYKNLKNNESNDSIANVWSNRLFSANRSYDSLMLALETNYPEYYNLKYNNAPATVEQVANLLDKKTAMLSYFIGDSTITIFAVSGKKSSRKVNDKNFVVCQVAKPDSLNEWIRYYRDDISETDILADEVAYDTHWSVDEYKKLASRLYNLLLPTEIQEFLKGGRFYDIENLIIIPDGQLATLPFETLLTEEYNAEWTNWSNKAYFSNMPYLIKDYAISYSYSATLFQQTFSEEKTAIPETTNLNDWLALAPVFDGVNSISRLRDGNSVSSLPGTETEVKTISKLYEEHNKTTKINLFTDANEAFVKSGELKNYKILHFATHGFVNTEKPELSGIILAQDTTIAFEGYENIYGNIAQQNDGILYQSEIYNLELNADLIVLSACQTGLGKITTGEGVIGLTRALLYAGTDNIVVSLWSVSDASTAELMINFYENILDKNSDKNSDRVSNPVRVGFNAPLRDAKLKMIEEGKYAHPYFWSPFILIGE